MVRLYKVKNGKWVLADIGVASKADEYARQGYLVIRGSGK